MKKAIALFFCLQILTGNTFAVEVARLPFLVQHFLEHAMSHHHDTDVDDFLVEHYTSSPHVADADDHSDADLPFKHCHDCCSQSGSVTASFLPESSVTIQVPCGESEIIFDSGFSCYSSYSCYIWQPPKI